MVSKMLSPWERRRPMDTRIANRAINTIEAISWTAIIIVVGMILTIIGAGIYGSLGLVQ